MTALRMPPPAFRFFPGLQDPPSHIQAMERQALNQQEAIWVAEYSPVYTLGRSSHPGQPLPEGIPKLHVERGGQATYHGPGQRLIYPILHLSRRCLSFRDYLLSLQGWMIAALGELGLQGYYLPQAPGIWVQGKKVISMGFRIRQGWSSFGLSVNVTVQDFSPFLAISPCGLPGSTIGSLDQWTPWITLQQWDSLLKKHLPCFHGSQ